MEPVVAPEQQEDLLQQRQQQEELSQQRDETLQQEELVQQQGGLVQQQDELVQQQDELRQEGALQQPPQEQELEERLRDQELRYSEAERELMEENQQFLQSTNTVMDEERQMLRRTLSESLSARRAMAQGGAAEGTEEESDKAKRKRQKEYEKMRREHGDQVTMKTVYLKEDLEKYWKEREKTGSQWAERGVDIRTLADQIDLSPEMMENVRQKGGLSYPDLPRLLRTRDAISYIIEKNYNPRDERLTPEQQMRVMTGVRVYTRLSMAIRRLLYENSIDMRGRYFHKEDYELDERGELVRRDRRRPQGNEGMDMQNESIRLLFEGNQSSQGLAGASEIRDFRRTLSAAMRQEGEVQDLTLSDEARNALQEASEREREARRRAYEPRMTALAEIPTRANIGEQRQRAARELYRNISLLDEKILAKEALIRAIEAQLGDLEQGENAQSEDVRKLRLRLMVEKGDESYYEALRQSARMERMLRAVGGENSPESMLTMAMRLELAEKYDLPEFAKGLKLGKRSEEELNTEQALIEEDNVRQEQAGQNQQEQEREEADRERGKEEKQLDELESILGDRSMEELSEAEREKYGALLEKLNSDQNRIRKLRIRHLERWLETNMRGLKNSLDTRSMEDLGAENMEESVIESAGQVGDLLYETLLWQNRIESTLRVALGGEDGLKDLPLVNAFLSAHSQLATGEDVLVQLLTQPALLSEIGRNFRDGEMKQAFLNLTQNLGSLTSSGAGLWEAIEKARGASQDVIDNLSLAGGIGDSVYHGVDTVKEALAAHEARMRRNDLQALEGTITGEDAGSLEQAELMQNLARTGSRTAGTDLMLHAERSVTHGMRTVSSILSICGITAVAGVAVSWVTKVTDMIFSVAGKRQKRTSRKLHIQERFQEVFNEIRRNRKFRGISSRDLKHTVLRFAGVSTGKRSEAALRSLTIESHRLLSGNRLGDMKEELRKRILEKFHIKEDAQNQGATRERMKEFLEKLGASSRQAANPLQAINAIRRRERDRRKNGRPGFFRRAMRGLKKSMALDE